MGYDVYDLGFRTYYPAISRFTNIDPLAERFYSQSPYVYAANNPVRYIDFLGLAAATPPNELTNQNNNEMPNDDTWLGSGGSSFMDGCGFTAYNGFLRIGLYEYNQNRWQ